MSETNSTTQDGLLLVANWDSNVGYAWWLMESYWVEIEKLYRSTCTVHLCYPSISVLPANIEDSNINLHTLEFFPDNSHWLQQCLFLYRNHIKCIYFSDQPLLKWRYLLYRLFGVKKIIMHDHCPGLRKTPHGLKRMIKSVLMRLPLVNVDAIIGATSFVQQRAIDSSCVPSSKAYCVTNGIPIKKSNESLNNHGKFNIPADRKIMICTGRAHDYKGIPFVLNCLAQLIHEQQRQDIHFLFCGDGPHLNKFHQLVETLSISEYVTLAGRQNDIGKILNDCDFAIHPSQGEVGYSLSILEYMQAELPVIVPDNLSVCGATIHNETGLIYKEHDINAACSAITSLLNDPVLVHTMGNKSKQKILCHYTLDKTHDSLASVMNTIYPTTPLQKTT